MNGPVIVFHLPGNEALGAALADTLQLTEGSLFVRDFPDGETYVRGDTRCEGRDVVLAANLYQPNAQVMPLTFCAQALRDFGARRIVLVTPYLPYMRQDARFQPGEVITSRIFARWLNQTVDGLVTVDPHLHRYTTLGELYSIPTRVQHAASAIADWIRTRVERPVIVGPDKESEQWVSEVADLSNAPFILLSKTRQGDHEVNISVPPLDPWREYTPVLVDDIISTARTMIETIGHLNKAGYRPPLCIGVHGVFATGAYEDLLKSEAAEIVTCNTVKHPSNAIDVTSEMARGVIEILETH